MIFHFICSQKQERSLGLQVGHMYQFRHKLRGTVLQLETEHFSERADGYFTGQQKADLLPL